jgi:TrmH family RNA methyltransferase
MRIKTITSLSNPQIKDIRALDAKKYRDAGQVFVIEGLRHVMDALAGGFTAQTVLFSQGAAGINDVMAQALDAEYLEVTQEILQKVTHRDNAQDIVAVFAQRTAPLASVQDGLWVALQDIRDPGNLGTIIRTADAVAAQGVILIGQTCDPWSPEALRATMGSFARVAIAVATAQDFAAWKKTFSGRVIGTHLKGAVDYRTADYTRPMVLLMGSESAGLSDDVADLCDQLVKIPMPGGTESLNLAVSTGVMLYEVSREKI